MDLNPIDPEPYVRSPRLAVDSGLSLAKKLMRVVPSKPNAGVQQGAKLLAQSVTTLATAWHESGKARPLRNARPADLRLDRAWGAVHARLTAWTVFPPDDPDHETSTALADRLFPTGLDFLRLPFMAEHAQSERRVKIIENEALRADLDHLVGEAFMDELLAAHAAYGDALGITKATEAATPEPAIDEPLRMLSQAIVAYALQVVAFGALPGNLEAARRALRPIDEFRAAAGRRTSSGARGEEKGAVEEAAEEAEPEAATAEPAGAVG
jgi:hypothetical protein